MDRLSRETLSQLSTEHLLREDSKATLVKDASKIVHIGLGQFAKAHLAFYLQALANGRQSDQEPWQLTGISLNSNRSQQQLNPQDNLYTVTARAGEDTQVQLIDILADVFFVEGEGLEGARSALLDAETKIVSLTITEKGYHQAENGKLDLTNPDIQHDLQHIDQPITAIGWLVWAIRERRLRGRAPFTIMSLDNLQQNGRVLGSILAAFAEAFDPELASFIKDELVFPCSMVDRIVPAVDADIVKQVSLSLGVQDEACVVTEHFTQWALEDKFVSGRPQWERVGVQICDEVEPFESMKLRLLNGAHSAIAYLGYLCEFETVAQCMQSTELKSFIERLMKTEIQPQVVAPAGVNLDDYIDSLLVRFSNVHLNHRCEQIAMDGSQKIPQRWVPVMAERLQSGSSIELLTFSLAAWIKFLQQKDDLQDPMAAELKQCLTVDSQASVRHIIDTKVFPVSFQNERFVSAVSKHLESIERVGVAQAIQDIVQT